MATVTTTNGTGTSVSFIVDDPDRIEYLRSLVERGDLVSVVVDEEAPAKKAAAPKKAPAKKAAAPTVDAPEA